MVSAYEINVAHMWRTPDDPRTNRKYNIPTQDPYRNKARAAAVWYDEFAKKLDEFPAYNYFASKGGKDWYGDVSKARKVKSELQCKPFAWYLHRFSSVYVDTGLVPKKIFHLRDSKSKLCLTFTGQPGTSMHGHDSAKLAKCDKSNDRQRWHGANKNPEKNGKCCSSLRAWNTDQCLDRLENGYVKTTVCDLSGERGGRGQRWTLNSDGTFEYSKGTRNGGCLVSQGKKGLTLTDCESAKSVDGIWKRGSTTEPPETTLYNDAVKAHPEWR